MAHQPSEHSRPAASPRTASQKHSILDPSPLILGKSRDLAPVTDFSLDQPKQFPAAVAGKRLSGRHSKERLVSSPRVRPSDHPHPHPVHQHGALPVRSIDRPPVDETVPDEHSSHNLFAKVQEWLLAEKARQRRARQRRRAEKHATHDDRPGSPVQDDSAARRRASDTSEGSVALDRLQSILEHSTLDGGAPPRSHARKKLLRRPRSSTVSSDTDYIDGDAPVPACDALLDNARTLSYFGGEPSEAPEARRSSARTSLQEREAWATFKYEIVRLTHTLRLKRWRQVPLSAAKDIDVERLSGALTNAVYVVTPPRDLPAPPVTASDGGRDGAGSAIRPRKPPRKLLLRIYGPQVEHLIDRDSELAILQRLGRKNIGPKLLGTFANGRFEEYFHARPLSPKDLRDPGTSIQIAKRMRELHDGIALEREEIAGGPFVWRNWDRWVQRCEQRVSWLDRAAAERGDGDGAARLLCGVPWPVFRRVVDQYRAWLIAEYGSVEKIEEALVFAHNDTQYGNILRLSPSGSSPLLLPANEHRQLIVIDFEYANANVRGLEFANHFTEWCYNYHSAAATYACNAKGYPTPDEQFRFIKAYVLHRPKFERARPAGLGRMDSGQSNVGNDSETPASSVAGTPTASEPATPASTRPGAGALKRSAGPGGSTGSLSQLLSDARAPAGTGRPPPPALAASTSSLSLASPSMDVIGEETRWEPDALDGAAVDETVQRLMRETMLWRGANSAQWVAWGIVQAVIPAAADGAEEREEEGEKTPVVAPADAESTAATNGTDSEEPAEEFDYLSYARERAMFFWGDMLQLGIVAEEELPAEVLAAVKRVPY